jgi:hypothetical protein
MPKTFLFSNPVELRISNHLNFNNLSHALELLALAFLLESLHILLYSMLVLEQTLSTRLVASTTNIVCKDIDMLRNIWLHLIIY